MRDMKKLLNRKVATTALEVLGGFFVVLGIGSFSIPIGVIVLGVLLIMTGGFLA